MNTPSTQDTAQWVTEWLDGVADGSNTMSQRKLTSVDKKGGGIEALLKPLLNRKAFIYY